MDSKKKTQWLPEAPVAVRGSHCTSLGLHSLQENNIKQHCRLCDRLCPRSCRVRGKSAALQNGLQGIQRTEPVTLGGRSTKRCAGDWSGGGAWGPEEREGRDCRVAAWRSFSDRRALPLIVTWMTRRDGVASATAGTVSNPVLAPKRHSAHCKIALR
jgi:hypothetical protein